MQLVFFCTLKSSKPQGFGCFQGLAKETGSSMKWVHPLSANPTKRSNTQKLFVAKKTTNCLSVFDNFLLLALKGLIIFIVQSMGACSLWEKNYLVSKGNEPCCISLQSLFLVQSEDQRNICYKCVLKFFQLSFVGSLCDNFSQKQPHVLHLKYLLVGLSLLLYFIITEWSHTEKCTCNKLI